jgi:hypothetical protein
MRKSLRRTIALACIGIGSCLVADGSPYGICAHTAKDLLLDKAAEAGIEWIRIDFLWAAIEPEENQLDWSAYDRLITSAEARGLRIYATIAQTPYWATTGSPEIGVPSDPDDWQEFCYRAAARYRGRVDAWGFWNEPNLDSFWEGTRNEYIEHILLPGAAGVRAADPQALICGPDLAQLSSANWDTWLEEILVQAGPIIDIITHHLYPSGRNHRDVNDALNEGGSYSWEDPSVKEVLTWAGAWGRPFWLTETGVESDISYQSAQAHFLTGLLDDWFGHDRKYFWIDKIFFYELSDGHNPDNTWGILGPAPNHYPKQAYTAYAHFIETEAVDGAKIVSSSFPTHVLPYTTYDAQIKVLNTGSTTWTTDYRLEMVVDYHGWFVNPDDLWLDHDVPPGVTSTFHLSMRSPERISPLPPKVFTITWQMVRDEVWSFGTPLRNEVSVARDEVAEIVFQPSSTQAPPAGSATFTVVAESPSEVTYQWQRNSINLTDGDRYSGVNSPVLEVNQVGVDITGEYVCVISNAGGSVATRPALLGFTSSSRRPRGRVVIDGVIVGGQPRIKAVPEDRL